MGNDGSIGSQVLEELAGIVKSTGKAIVTEPVKTAQSGVNQMDPAGKTLDETVNKQAQDDQKLKALRERLHQEVLKQGDIKSQKQTEYNVTEKNETPPENIQSSQKQPPPLPQNIQKGTRETLKVRE